MSKIQGKPFIESVLKSLQPEQKTTLLGYVNGTDKDPKFRSLINSRHWITDTGDYDKVSHIILETYNKTYTGYLIYNEDYCVLIAYALNSQELNVLDINLTNKSYKLIKEPLNILELRFELEEAKEGTDVIEDVKGAIASGDLNVQSVYEVANIKAVGDDILGKVKAGDIINKITGNQKHAYVVSYKENNTGICLTYTDASVVETQSYDYTAGHWVYNSEDKSELGASSSEEVIAYEGTVSIEDTNLQFEDWSLHRAIKDGNILWLVVSGIIKNIDTSASHRLTQFDTLLEVTLPQNISSKIYRGDGTTCNNAYIHKNLILSATMCLESSEYVAVLSSTEANKLVIKLNSTVTWTANTNKAINIRIPIFLDIGTTQA